MKLRRLLLSLALTAACATLPRADELFDHSAFGDILHRSVDKSGLVHYDDIRQNTYSALDSYLVRVGEADLNGWPKDAKLAFWIDAYNARILQLIVARPNLKKVSDDFNMLNIPFPVAGRKLSPNDIVFRILRRRKNPDNQLGPIPLVSMDEENLEALFALYSGAVGSPRLRDEAYTGANVQRMIHEDAVAFVNDPKNVNLGPAQLELSSLFRWYKADFTAAGGLDACLHRWLDPDQHADDSMYDARLKNLLPKATYRFDWTVNAAPPTP